MNWYNYHYLVNIIYSLLLYQGITMDELELLTLWLTHLYCRCTRSVSLVTPAYYAHWAAKRGKAYISAHASMEEVQAISEAWLHDTTAGMYYI